MADAGWSRRSRRSWRRCEHVGPTVVRATFSPTVALLLLLVASLLPDHIVLFCYCATRCCSAHATWLLVAAGRQVLVPVGHEQLRHGPPGPGQLARHARDRQRVQNASWAAHHPPPAARGELVYLVFGVGQPVPQLENGLLKIFRLVCGSSAQAPSCWRERRRQMSCAATAGGLAEWPRA